MSGVDHTSLSVADFAKAKAFYVAALKPLGITVLMEFPKAVTGNVDVAGLGSNGKPFFWLAAAGKTTPRIHIAFTANSRAEVDAFYKAAIDAGGTDNGPPGIRAMYHPTYYGAFVLDADGHNVEAVCHKPE
jgi:catechol 2,3-dioxygenase-like lactoylglutathione lyase family enzyme